jgi:hypothetical protein
MWKRKEREDGDNSAEENATVSFQGFKSAGTNEEPEEEEDDYMSEELLKKMEKEATKMQEKKKMYQLRPNEVKNVVSPKVLEQENRAIGLSKPIDEKNKGFQMLAKMGFK